MEFEELKQKIRDFVETIKDLEKGEINVENVNANFEMPFVENLKILLFFIAYDINGKKTAKYIDDIQNLTNKKSKLFENMAKYTLTYGIAKNYADTILDNLDMFLVDYDYFADLKHRDYTKDVLNPFKEILSNWKKIIDDDDLDCIYYNEAISIAENVLKNKNKPLETNLSENKVKYQPLFIKEQRGFLGDINYARNKFYLGADIVNPNKFYAAQNVKLVITFFSKGMVVSSETFDISLIDADEVLHFGCVLNFDPSADQYDIRINSANYGKVENKLNIHNGKNGVLIENMNARVIGGDIKISCQAISGFNYLYSLEIYVQLLKNGKIVGGIDMIEYGINAGGVYNFIETIPGIIDFDDIAFSVIPNIR